MEYFKFFLLEKIKFFPWRRFLAVIFVFVILLVCLFFALLAYANSYNGRVLPGIFLNGKNISGWNKEQLSDYLQEMNKKLLDEGIKINLHFANKDEKLIFYPEIINNEEYLELVKFDVVAEVDRLLSYHRQGNQIKQAWNIFQAFITRTSLPIDSIEVKEDQLRQIVEEKLSVYEIKSKNASVEIKSPNPLVYKITTSTIGLEFPHEQIIKKIIKDLSILKSPQVELTAIEIQPEINEEMIKKIEGDLINIFKINSLNLVYFDSGSKRDYNWLIKNAKLSEWIEVQKKQENNEVVFGLKSEFVKEFLKTNIAEMIEVKPENAKFEIGNNLRVKEFNGSRPGVTLDIDKTYIDINKAILKNSKTEDEAKLVKEIAVSVREVEPEIKTGSINDLGIKEILGVGYSNYRGSPTNRVKNISHAVYDRLNGLLIKPDETFSLLNALKPFTAEAGYLPELVIKGDKIKPEIGGGLCQIGTTMFRAALNSGLPIIERSNHSLVVNYYNDKSNNKPGTDATIYDPAPDLKFKNDTGNYILISTEINFKTSDIYFTLWGTSDGRKGYYTPPEVLNWIPTGPTKEIETTDLPVGKKQCQSRHPGANAKFTYIREFSDGTKEERIFKSYYRSLPEICLIGVEKLSVICEEGEECPVIEEPLDEVLPGNTTTPISLPIE